MSSPKTSRRTKVSIEKVLRQSLKESLKDYMRNSSLAGAKFVFDPNIGIIKRIFWTIIFCLALGSIGYFLKYTWSDTLAKPLIVTLESTDHSIEHLDFPAVAICNVNRISKKALEKFAVKEFPYLTTSKNQTLKDVFNALVNLGRLLDMSYKESLERNPIFKKMKDRYRTNSSKIIQIMKDLAPKCEETLITCAWSGDTIDCNEIFQLRRAGSKGHCCTFNFVLDFENLGNLKRIESKVRRQFTSGWLYGLTFVLDPMLDDYIYPIAGIPGFDIMIFNPMQFPEASAGQVIHRISEPNTALFLELKSTMQIATSEVKKYNIETRRCLFHNELPEYGNMYSYSTCLVYCQLLSIRSLCKCIPYYYAQSQLFSNTSVCSMEDLMCLNKYSDKLTSIYPYQAEDITGLEVEIQNSILCKDCLPDCELIDHKISGYKTALSDDHESKAIQDMIVYAADVPNKSFVSVYFPTQDANLVRLDVVFYWFEILSSFGGFCGIFVGLSIFSVAEIVYFFTIRFVQHCHFNYNYKKY